MSSNLTPKVQYVAMRAHFNTNYATNSQEICTSCFRLGEFGSVHKCVVSVGCMACDNCHFCGLKCFAIPIEINSIINFYLNGSVR
ncbi:hypothetical protein I7I53_09061 [Histoplasma capsulatum var. duboisii H88]|uniref:Uncharacterized protein n=1 Tax=Ajellomyces capsulatus (strain H88) TaxID=544711 RepID=A0A8A1L468_AJEC8|nr:hypothetical protein I7I53_09061 [Histoplasma capsulatum var. duboisii H88]